MGWCSRRFSAPRALQNIVCHPFFISSRDVPAAERQSERGPSIKIGDVLHLCPVPIFTIALSIPLRHPSRLRNASVKPASSGFFSRYLVPQKRIRQLCFALWWIRRRRQSKSATQSELNIACRLPLAPNPIQVIVQTPRTPHAVQLPNTIIKCCALSLSAWLLLFLPGILHRCYRRQRRLLCLAPLSIRQANLIIPIHVYGNAFCTVQSPPTRMAWLNGPKLLSLLA